MFKVTKKAILVTAICSLFSSVSYADLPDPGVQLDTGNTALVITDPQVDFLSPKGVTWGVVGKSVEANNTV